MGVQFRNGATVGGSVFGRFGFSDIVTCLLALDVGVELYQKGMVSLEEFCRMKRDRDILLRIRIKKDGRRAAYAAGRLSKTDFPVIACCVAKKGGQLFFSVGARPAKAELVVLTDGEGRTGEELALQVSECFRYGGNIRGSAEYREHLTRVYVKRLLEQLCREEG